MSGAAPKCPYCGTLNSRDQSHCHNCKEPLPGPLWRWLTQSFKGLLGDDLPVTKLILGLNVVPFALMLLDARQIVTLFSPAEYSVYLRAGLLYMHPVAGVPEGYFEPYQIVSAMFCHYGILHIGFNMTALLRRGRELEPLLGSGRFALAYMVTGIVSFACSALWGVSTTAGASGAVFGLFGLTIGVMRRMGNSAWKEALVEIGVSALLFAFMLPMNNVAHATGFASGFALAYLFIRSGRRTARRSQSFAVLAVLLFLLGPASLVAAQLDPSWKQERAREISKGGWK